MRLSKLTGVENGEIVGINRYLLVPGSFVQIGRERREPLQSRIIRFSADVGRLGFYGAVVFAIYNSLYKLI